MSWRRHIARLRRLIGRRHRVDELDEEIREHLELETEENRAAGLPPEEARYAARRRFGNVTLTKEESREMWIYRSLEIFLQDVRFGLRMLVKNPGFTIVAVLTLALGIGANTAIYSFMDSLLLRSLPVADPSSLAVLNWRAQKRSNMTMTSTVIHSMNGQFYPAKSGMEAGIFPFPAFEFLQQRSGPVFSAVFAYYPAPKLTVMAKGQASLANGEYVSGDYFRGLAVSPAAGRLILPDDDRAGAPAVAVVSFGFSQDRFGGAAGAVGQSILINNVPFLIAGVTPPQFSGVDPAAAPGVYLPVHANLLVDAANQFGVGAEDYLDKNSYWIEVMGRLRPGVSLAQAQAALAPPFQQWVASTAATDEERANLPTLLVKEGASGLDSLRREYSKPLYVLLTLVALILAIACANVANLQLARATARRREMALRLSVGAGRLRLVRQLLTESVLLALLGGIVGIVFAIWGIRFLTLLLAGGQTDFTLHVELNWRVLNAAAGLSLLTGVLFGLAPAMQSARVDVMPAMKETRAGESGARHAFRRISLSHVLVAGQIAISLLMLFAAGLFVRTLANLQSVDLGFHRENVLLFELNARQAGHQDPEIAVFYADLWKRFGSIPGVLNASLADSSLIQASHLFRIGVSGAPPNAAQVVTVGPEFCKTMQIPVVAGREIDERDQPGSQPVAVVNELFAKTNFPGRNPLGQHITMQLGSARRDVEIIGMAKDTRYGGLKRRTRPGVFVPYNQNFLQTQEMTYALRTAANPLTVVNAVREIVRQADARVALFNVRTQAAEINQTINQEIIFARLCTAFALLALVIAAVGLYGTVAYNIARRTSEIGVRMALGAQRASVVWNMLREVFVLSAAGLAISMPVALGASKFVASFLFGITPNDPLALTVAVAILFGAALLAGYFPARKASRIDPVTALRHE